MSGCVMCLCPQAGFGLSACVCVRMLLLVGSLVVNISVVASMSLSASVWVERGRLVRGRLSLIKSAMACCQAASDSLSPLDSVFST
jgi:hypothetical protein